MVFGLIILFILLMSSSASGQLADSTSFEGNFGSFSPSTDRPDQIAPQLTTQLAHTGRYSVRASADNGQESLIVSWYFPVANGIHSPFLVTIWVFVDSQAGGDLEFAKFWAFAGTACSWLIAISRTSGGSVVAYATSRDYKSSYSVSIGAWHKFAISFDHGTLKVLADDNVAITATIEGEDSLCSVNLGILDTANSRSASRRANIGYGTVYFDDYSVEHGAPLVITQTTSETTTLITTTTSVSTLVLEVVPSWVYGALPVVALGGAVVAYALVGVRRKAGTAKSVPPSENPCVKCGASLPVGAKFCDNCGTSQP